MNRSRQSTSAAPACLGSERLRSLFQGPLPNYFQRSLSKMNAEARREEPSRYGGHESNFSNYRVNG